MSHADLRAAIDDVREELWDDFRRWFPRLFGPDAVVPPEVQFAMELGGEAGELLNALKKATRAGGLTSDDLESELADVFGALLLCSRAMRIDLVAAWRAKHTELHRRWDPPAPLHSVE